MSESFKGIALFTPGGDLVYCLDPTKQEHWHLHLCVRLQEVLNLPEPPHFLVPAYTATVDRGWHPQKEQLETWAEVYPAVQRHCLLLEALFDVPHLQWQRASWREETCNPLLIETYRQDFPQLWQRHDLILPYHWSPTVELPATHSFYSFNLFVAGHSINTRQTLKVIHELLETNLSSNYTLKVVDISKHPEQAETNNITATPTLIRISPQPIKRVVGALEDTERVLKIIMA